MNDDRRDEDEERLTQTVRQWFAEGRITISIGEESPDAPDGYRITYPPDAPGAWHAWPTCSHCGTQFQASGVTLAGVPVPEPPIVRCPGCGQPMALVERRQNGEDSQP